MNKYAFLPLEMSGQEIHHYVILYQKMRRGDKAQAQSPLSDYLLIEGPNAFEYKCGLGSCNLFHNECLEDIALFDIVEFIKSDTAFVALRYLARIILESLKR